MRKLLLPVLVLCCQASFASPLPFSLDSCVKACMEEWKVPGVAIAIVKDDSVVTCRGYGVCREGESRPVNGVTVFAIGSATKAFTAAVIGTLVKEGKLSWDDTVSKLLPAFKLYDECATRGVTVRDLLCHRCGFGQWNGDLLWYGSQYGDDTIIARLRFLRPAWPLRSTFGYSNLMYLVAGKVASTVTQTPWSVLVKKRFFEPLGMSHAKTSVRELSGLYNVADPHTVFDSRVSPITYRMLDNIGAAGAIIASADDLARWLLMQLNHGRRSGAVVVDSTVILETRTPQMLMPRTGRDKDLFAGTNFTAYGLGWMLEDYYGRLLVYHGGGVDGMLCRIGFVPDERLGIVVLSNLDNHKLHDALFYEILDGYLNIPSRDWSSILHEQWKAEQRPERSKGHPITMIAKPERLYGSYYNDLYGAAAIFKSGRECIMHLKAHLGLQGPLMCLRADTMVCTWRDRYFGKSYPVFEFDSGGNARAFTVKVREDCVDPLEYRFVRTWDVPAKSGSR